MSSQDLVRAAAFEFVDQLTEHGERAAHWADLSKFTFHGTRVPLVGPQGIFKPAVLDLPISILTAYRAPGRDRPYDDQEDANGFIYYRYRGTDPQHHENVALREIRDCSVPLLYFQGIARGRYAASAVYIIDDRPKELTIVAVRMPPENVAIASVDALALDPSTRRHYLAIIQQRTGQARFRETVLNAYRSRCTLCQLRHRQLLDAAHIVLYAEGGAHHISNGMTMCKIHHAAYDSNIVGIRPDGIAQVRKDVLDEEDGPMLRHGLQGLHGASLYLPRSPAKRPATEALETRWERFRAST